MSVVTFDNGLSANIHRHRWKERLKTIKLAECDSDMLETSKDNRGIVPQRWRLICRNYKISSAILRADPYFHSERFHNTRQGHLSEHVKERGTNIKALFTMVLANSCKQLKNRGSDGCWKIEKCFVKKDTDRCIRRTLSTAKKKNIVSWSHKTPKSTIQNHFCNFLATIFPCDLNALLIPFSHWKARRPWERALRKKLLRLRISPDRRLGRICSMMAASFGRETEV